MSDKLIPEKWLSDYLDGYDVGALVKGDLGAFTMLNNFRVALIEAPAVDAVEVVRCRDCKHRVTPGKMCAHPKAIGWDAIEPEDDDFCSYGERKEK